MKLLSNTKEYYLIETEEDVSSLEEIISQVEYVAFDTETNGLNTRKNKVIGFSFSTAVGNGYFIPLYVWNKQTQKLMPYGLKTWRNVFVWLKKKKLIMHNGAFDTKICFNNLEEDLLSSFHADTILMQHTLQEEGPFGLKEIALELAMKLGIPADEVANQEQIELKENVISNGGAWLENEKEMFKADVEVLAKYAAADTDLCLRIFYHYENELINQNLHDFFYKDEVMPLQTLCTIGMEFEGVQLDMPKLIAYNSAILKELEKIQIALTEEIINTPEGKEFLSQRCDKKVPVKNSGVFAQAVAEHYELPLPKTESGKYSLTKKTIAALPDSEAKTFLLNNVPLSETLSKKLQIKLLHERGEFFNIASKSQLSSLVFDIMQIEPLSKTAKGSPQFNEDMIEHLAKEHNISWAKELRVFNKLTKTKTGYYDRFLEYNEDGIYYPSFKQFGTISGRYSSDFQQLSRPLEEGADDPRVVYYTNTLRELIIAKPGHILVDDDFESLEPRIFSDNSGDPALIEIFEKDEDFYSKVGIAAENIPGVSANKKDKNYLKNIYPKKRQDMKEYALGLRYGMRDGKLADVLNITKIEAQKIIEGYFKAFPKLKEAMDESLKQAKETGMVRNKFGRIRHMPMAKHIYRKYGDVILDYKNLYKLSRAHGKSYDEMKQLRKTYSHLLNNALNFPIQATAASIVNRAMVAMTREFRKRNLEAWIILTIHDEVVVSCKREIVDEVKAIVQDAMENTTKLSMKLIAIPQEAECFRDGH